MVRDLLIFFRKAFSFRPETSSEFVTFTAIALVISYSVVPAEFHFPIDSLILHFLIIILATFVEFLHTDRRELWERMFMSSIFGPNVCRDGLWKVNFTKNSFLRPQLFIVPIFLGFDYQFFSPQDHLNKILVFLPLKDTFKMSLFAALIGPLARYMSLEAMSAFSLMSIRREEIKLRLYVSASRHRLDRSFVRRLFETLKTYPFLKISLEVEYRKPNVFSNHCSEKAIIICNATDFEVTEALNLDERGSIVVYLKDFYDMTYLVPQLIHEIETKFR